MRLVFNLQNVLPIFSVEESAKLVSQAGFDGTDFYLQEMTDTSSVFHSDNWLDYAQNCRRVFSDAGSPITQTHAPYSFKGWENPNTFEDFIYPTLVRSIEVSAALGAECVVVHPLHHWRYEGNEQDIFERNMAFYRSLIPVCKNCGIKVGIENMFQRDKLRGNYIIHDTCADVTEFCRYIDTLNSEYMVACLDVGHVGLPSGHLEAWDFIRILGHDRLQALHIHDNDYTNDQHLVPFAGKIDWQQVTKALGEIDYTGNFTFECLLKKMAYQIKPELYPAVLSYVAQVGRHLIESIESHRPNAANI